MLKNSVMNSTVTPRFNLAQLIGFIFLLPAFIIINVFFFSSSSIPFSGLLVNVGIFTFLGGSFLLKLKWIRYIIGVGTLIIFIFVIPEFLNDTIRNLRETGATISLMVLLISVFLLMFNYGLTIEFERPKNASINYTKALEEFRYGKMYFLKNTLDLFYIISLIFFAPTFAISCNLYYEFYNDYFSITDFYDIALLVSCIGFWLCGLACLLKFPILPKLLVIFFIILIGMFSLGFIFSGITIQVANLLFTGVYGVILILIFRHPLTIQFFNKKHLGNDDLEDILDA